MEFLSALTLLFVVALVTYVVSNLASEDPGLAHGVYAVRGRWYYLKYVFTRVFLTIARRNTLHIRRIGKSLQHLRAKIGELQEREFCINVPKHTHEKTKRGPRSRDFSVTEVFCLIEFVQSNKTALFGTGGKGSGNENMVKKSTWKKAAARLRAAGGPERDWVQVRKKWRDLASKAKEYKLPKTGGGPPPETNEMFEKVLDILAKESVYGILPETMAGSQGKNLFYVNASDQKGETRLVVRVTIRPDDRRDIWFLLRLPGVGDLVLPQHPDCIISNVRGDGFIGAGLTCTPIEGLLTWRISFNGLCRVGVRQDWSQEDKRPLVHLRCTLLWSAYSPCFDFSTDVHPSSAAANIAREKFTTQFLTTVRESIVHPDRYSQFGAVHGTVQVENEPEQIITLRGIKERLRGTRSWADFHTYIKIYVVLHNGTSLYVEAICIPGELSNATGGFLATPFGQVYSAVSTDLALEELMDETEEAPRSFCFTANFENGRSYHIRVEVETFVYFHMGDSWNATICEGLSRFKVNGVSGRGVCETLQRYDGGRPVPPVEQLPRVHIQPDKIPLSDYKAWVLPLNSSSCKLSSLTGGKGSQLAMLTSIQKQKKVQFKVPYGFCITTEAFKFHLKSNKALREAVEELSEVARNVREGDLKAACDKTVKTFNTTELSADMKKAIADQFELIFGDPEHTKAFAVRSSAVGEDTSQMSAAGQMETYLGLKGIEKVFAKTQECWASQFSFQAVQYRRQYGQTVESAMCVVVQEIVQAQTAGVVFSRDPMTGNPSKIVINANYGLGESVVAGVSEADTISLHVEGGSELSIHNKKIGRKKEAIVVSEQGGTEVAQISENESATCAVSDELCFKLGRIALLLDACFGDARDIEWAIVDDRVYLLQARAITTFDVPSQYELLHEFDSGMSTDQICTTTANIQEMCPGSVTPLTVFTFFHDVELAFQYQFLHNGNMHLCSPQSHVLYNFYGQKFFSVSGLMSSQQQSAVGNPKEIGYSLCGQDVGKKIIDDAVKMTDQVGLIERWYNMYLYIHLMYKARRELDRDYAALSHGLFKSWPTAQEQFDDIRKHKYDTPIILTHHLTESGKSSIFRAILGSLLASSRSAEDAVGQANMLLSSCPDVESARVPLEMEQVAQAITKEGMAKTFGAMEAEEAADWLKSQDSGNAGKTFAEFIKNHGHRCVKEVELREKSWGMDPVQIIPVLQAILSGPSTETTHEKKYLTAEEAVDSLNPKITSTIMRKIIIFLVEVTRKAVADRERSKSMFVKMNHRTKEAYWRLAHLMVKEGRIPDEDLLFFFTYNEIGRLLKDRSPAIIARALRRRRIYPEQNSYNFPLFSTGPPIPLSTENSDEMKTELKLHGMPISNGVVNSKATVVTELKDASRIKRGDILITRITDIGWSPYFPLISGLVTEIGGVLSHGAVVAREYGLPCVVNVHGATSLIKTGDIVILDGAKGTVEKVMVSDS